MGMETDKVNGMAMDMVLGQVKDLTTLSSTNLATIPWMDAQSALARDEWKVPGLSLWVVLGTARWKDRGIRQAMVLAKGRWMGPAKHRMNYQVTRASFCRCLLLQYLGVVGAASVVMP